MNLKGCYFWQSRNILKGGLKNEIINKRDYPEIKKISIVQSERIEQGRKNCTVAHELGHFCMDGLNKKAFYCSSEVIEISIQAR